MTDNKEKTLLSVFFGVKHQKQPNSGLFTPILANLSQIERIIKAKLAEL